MSWGIWIAGPPGLLSRRVAAALRSKGRAVRVLELEDVRRAIMPRPAGGGEEREVLHRALVYMATELVAVGVPALIDATAPCRACRTLAQTGMGRFAEVEIEGPARAGHEPEAPRHGHGPPALRPGAFAPDADVLCAPMDAPDLLLRTDAAPIETLVSRVATLAIGLQADDGRASIDGHTGGALWITGRPGTGKTTLARALAEVLALRWVRTRLLALDDVAERIEAHRLGAPRAGEIAHRVLAETARLLAEERVLVVVDGGVSRRPWREAARRLVPNFIEIELVCPGRVCEERERAARWDLWAAPGPPPPAHAQWSPGTAPAHEDSRGPELCIHTGVKGVDSTVQDILRALVQRLGDGLGRRPRAPALDVGDPA